MTGAVRRRSPAPLAPISSVPGAEPGTEGGVASLTVRVTEPLVAAAASALADAGFEHSVAAAISALHQQLPDLLLRGVIDHRRVQQRPHARHLRRHLHRLIVALIDDASLEPSAQLGVRIPELGRGLCQLVERGRRAQFLVVIVVAVGEVPERFSGILSRRALFADDLPELPPRGANVAGRLEEIPLASTARTWSASGSSGRRGAITPVASALAAGADPPDAMVNEARTAGRCSAWEPPSSRYRISFRVSTLTIRTSAA